MKYLVMIRYVSGKNSSRVYVFIFIFILVNISSIIVAV